MSERYDVAIVGGGFCGLSAGLRLAEAGQKVVIVESDADVGGLAGTFPFRDGVAIEKYYHHWFTHDEYVVRLAESLGRRSMLKTLSSRTGMYLNKRFWRLSSPLDLLKFGALPMSSRLQLGMVVLLVRFVKDWHALEGKTVREWLEPLCGSRAYGLVWEPLIRAKFGVFADQVNAVWFWKKLVLRGSTRASDGSEQLMYYSGGFGRLAADLAESIRKLGGSIRTSEKIVGARYDDGKIAAIRSEAGDIAAEKFLFTPSFPIIADILDSGSPPDWIGALRRVNYLGNICLVLELSRSLSETYWLNVNDPGFPFVGVIEHTNLDQDDRYRGRHIVYLSRYISTSEKEWGFDDHRYYEYALPWLKIMFPDFDEGWIVDRAIWRSAYAQPITERMYSEYLPGHKTPFSNALIYTMAQIYPEDRGTNYAIREGERAAGELLLS